jgi:hypothetical protein
MGLGGDVYLFVTSLAELSLGLWFDSQESVGFVARSSTGLPLRYHKIEQEVPAAIVCIVSI